MRVLTTEPMSCCEEISAHVCQMICVFVGEQQSLMVSNLPINSLSLASQTSLVKDNMKISMTLRLSCMCFSSICYMILCVDVCIFSLFSFHV